MVGKYEYYSGLLVPPVSTDDIFNVHLVKRAKVVHLTDAHEALYSVPLNSSIEFGLVYDPVDSDKKGDLVSAGEYLREEGRKGGGREEGGERR